jgi:hypothetical protein
VGPPRSSGGHARARSTSTEPNSDVHESSRVRPRKVARVDNKVWSLYGAERAQAAGNWWQIGRNPHRLKQAKTPAAGCDGLRRRFNSKEGSLLGFAGCSLEGLCAAISAGWRIHWRSGNKSPANRYFLGGLENRYPSLGGSRVRIPPPPPSLRNRLIKRFIPSGPVGSLRPWPGSIRRPTARCGISS